jgi:predicted Zn-dependent protease
MEIHRTMRARLPAFLILSFALALSSFAARKPHPPARLSSSAIHLVQVGDAPSGWGEAIAPYVQDTLWTPTDYRVVAAGSSNALDCCTTGEPASSNAVTVRIVVDDAKGSVATNWPPWELCPGQKCGVVHALALRPSPRDVGVAGGTNLWIPRIQVETAFVAARLLGEPVCTFPLCVMHGDRNLQDVDFKARNFCPPCYEKMRKLLGLPD